MKIGIIGTGAYGLALALTFNENHHQVTMWTKFEQEKLEIEQTHYNQRVLPDVKIPAEIQITNILKEAMEEKDLLVIALPVAFIHEIFQQMKPYYQNQIICIASKGIEQKTNRFVHEIIKTEQTKDHIVVLSGPTFAMDLVTKLPVGLTIATNHSTAESVIRTALENHYLTLQTSKDILGVELCGAIKNILAIGAGILDGLEANDSTKALFLTRAIQDLKQFIGQMGGEETTILSLAGIGDILLTCGSSKSRNFSFGQQLSTKNTEQIEQYKQTYTIEGYYTLQSIHELLQNHQQSFPIIEKIYDIVFSSISPKELLTFLTEKK